MQYIIFDIEANGLIEDVTRIHCLSYTILDEEANKIYSDTLLEYSHIIDFLNKSLEFVLIHL